MLKTKTLWKSTKQGINIMLFFYEEDKYICTMEPKEKNSRSVVKVPEKHLLSLVAEKLKDRVLFPHKLEEAKDYIKKLTFFNKGL